MFAARESPKEGNSVNTQFSYSLDLSTKQHYVLFGASLILLYSERAAELPDANSTIENMFDIIWPSLQLLPIAILVLVGATRAFFARGKFLIRFYPLYRILSLFLVLSTVTNLGNPNFPRGKPPSLSNPSS